MQINFCTKQQSIYRGLLLFFLVLTAHATDINIDKLILNAQKQNKKIMFFHHIPGCPYCKAMLDENFKDTTILKEIDKNFIYVDIYTADKGEIKFKGFKGTHKEFSAYIGAFVYPSTIFMDANANVIHKAIGYRNIDEYLVEMKYVFTKSYKTMDLESFIQKQEMEDF